MRRALLASLLLVACKSPPPVQDPGSNSPPVKPQELDRDEFQDGMDACPCVPGSAPDGCPEKDRDADGFLDSDDKCLNEVETRNGYLDNDGCPDVIPAELAAFTGTIKGIDFDLDKDTIKPRSFPLLDHAVAVLKEFDQVRIEIRGHLDNTTSLDYGRRLDKNRAHAVKRYLVEHGIAEGRIETRGAGPDEPIDTNKTAAGRANNRRIEFKILIQ
jgi:outer membrane protein OmpA-like peptidoglycan-associated protein